MAFPIIRASIWYFIRFFFFFCFGPPVVVWHSTWQSTVWRYIFFFLFCLTFVATKFDLKITSNDTHWLNLSGHAVILMMIRTSSMEWFPVTGRAKTHTHTHRPSWTSIRHDDVHVFRLTSTMAVHFIPTDNERRWLEGISILLKCYLITAFPSVVK